MLTKLVPLWLASLGQELYAPLLSYHRVAFSIAAHSRSHLGAIRDANTPRERLDVGMCATAGRLVVLSAVSSSRGIFQCS